MALEYRDWGHQRQELRHPAKTLPEVMKDVLIDHPEESFCFFNEGKLRETVSVLQENFLPNEEVRAIAYAVKSNPLFRVLEILSDEGIDHFDCASPTEIQRVQKVQPTASILYNHPIKREKDIRWAANSRVKHFTVQSENELDKVMHGVSPFSVHDDYQIVARLATPNNESRVNLSEKFGAEPEKVQRMINKILRETQFRPGISMHVGSQNTYDHYFEKGIIEMRSVLESLVGKVSIINLGGGVPVNYFEYDTFSTKEILQNLSRWTLEHLSQFLDADGKIIIELGRAIIAESVDLVVPVIAKERRSGQSCVYMNDGVFTSFSDAVVHKWKYPLKVIRKNGQEVSGNLIPQVLFGRTCDSGDTLKEMMLPKGIEVGDYIHVPAAGAYMDSQSTYFNGFEPPKYVSYNTL